MKDEGIIQLSSVVLTKYALDIYFTNITHGHDTHT